jgi:hypothetical protein
MTGAPSLNGATAVCIDELVYGIPEAAPLAHKRVKRGDAFLRPPTLGVFRIPQGRSRQGAAAVSNAGQVPPLLRGLSGESWRQGRWGGAVGG